MPNSLLKRLADNPKVKRVHRDREAHGEMARTAATVGALTARLAYGYTGAGVGVAVIDSGITRGTTTSARVRRASRASA